MITERLKQIDYYKHKLPMLLRNSYGYEEELQVLFEVLTQVDATADDLLKGIDIFSESYDITGDESDILDKLASLFGLARTFSFYYPDPTTSEQIRCDATFNNRQLITLIKARVVQMNFDGSREQAQAYYKNVKLPIYILTDQTTRGTCKVYLNKSEVQGLDVELLEKVFLSGLLTIKSMGIKYTHVVAEDLTGLLIFGSDNTNSVWGAGRWA